MKAINFFLTQLNAIRYVFQMHYVPFQRGLQFFINVFVLHGILFLFVCQLADLSCISQRYASLQERSKTSDYINVSESVSPGQVDFNNKIMAVDYVNVKKSQRKKINRKGQASCDDGTTSVSSDSSNASAVNYSMVVFTKSDK